MRAQKLRNKLCGPVVMMITPFTPEGKLDEAGLARHTRFLIENGMHAGQAVLTPAAGAGECFAMATEERKRVMEVVVEAAAGQATVVPGCNHAATDQSIDLARHAERIGADGALVTPTYYYQPSDEAVLRHYQAISAAVQIGIVVDNYPAVGKGDLSLDMLERLADLPHVTGISEGSPALTRLGQTVSRLGTRVAILNGNGEAFEPYGYVQGTVGFATLLANLDPRRTLAMHRAGLAGDWREGERLHKKMCLMLHFLDRLERTAGPGQVISAIKLALDWVGRPAGGVRSPLYPVEEEFQPALSDALQAWELPASGGKPIALRPL